MRYFKRNKIFSIVLIVVSIFIYVNYTRIIEPNSKINKNSIYYINDIYMSDARIYKNYLNKNEKKAYDEIMQITKNRKSKKSVDHNLYETDSTEEAGNYFITAHYAILIDHPELIQYSGISYKYTKDNLTINIHYAINNPMLEEINTQMIIRKIDRIKNATKNMTDLEKIKYVYEWIGDNAYYDTTFMTANKNQSIYNVFIKGNAVCAGFAKTSQVIFQNIGIESMTVTGNSTGPHMWNIIKYKGKYYYYDSTYAASIRDKSNKNYYNGLIQEEMNSYTMDYPEWYPTIETTNKLLKD